MIDKTMIRTVHDKQNPYVMLNKQSLWDENLSLEAAGLWARLLSKPDDWEVSVGHLRKSCGIGRDRVRRLLNELEKAGYLYRFQMKDGTKFGCMMTLVFESKEHKMKFQKDFPETEGPAPRVPEPENRPQQNTDYKEDTNPQSNCLNIKKDCGEVHNSGFTLPRTITKLRPDRSELQIKSEDIYRKAIAERRDWSTQEIKDAWKILCDYPGAVRDGYLFIAGTIENLRKNQKNDKVRRNKAKEGSDEWKRATSLEQLN